MNNVKNSIVARTFALFIFAALVFAGIAGTGAAVPSLSNSGGGNWQYYKEITISNSGSALSDYQVLVSLTSGNFPINARSDGADIRFTDASGNELSYWIESWDYAGKNAMVWVKVPSIPAGAIATIYMYNGNPSAGSASNGDATFLFFDDFNDNSRNGWNAIFDSDVFTEQNRRMEYSVGWNGMTQRNHILVANKVFLNFNFIIDFYSQTLGSGNYRSNGWAIYSSSSSFGAYTNYGDPWFGGSFCGNDGCSISPPFGMTSQQQTIGNCGNSNKHSISVRYDGSYLTVLCGNGAVPNVQIASFKGTLPSSYQFGLNGDEGGGGTTENHAYWDDFRVRKYAPSEPTITLGAEQPTVPPTTVPPTTVPPTTVPPTTVPPTTVPPTTVPPTTVPPTTVPPTTVPPTTVPPTTVPPTAVPPTTVPPTTVPPTLTTPIPVKTTTKTSASVNLYGEKTDVVHGEDILLKLSAVNYITKPKMHVQVILIPPSGMSVTSSEFSKSGAGQFTSNYVLEPGDGKDIEVRIKSNQVGDFNVNGKIIYYFGDEKDKGEEYDVNLPIKVRKETTSETNPAEKSPGFEVIVAGIGMILALALRRR